MNEDRKQVDGVSILLGIAFVSLVLVLAVLAVLYLVFSVSHGIAAAGEIIAGLRISIVVVIVIAFLLRVYAFLRSLLENIFGEPPPYREQPNEVVQLKRQMFAAAPTPPSRPPPKPASRHLRSQGWQGKRRF